MRLIRTLRDRLVALIHRDRVAGEIHDELQFHLDMRIAENIRRGMPPSEARREAVRRVGNVALLQDRGYDVRGGGFMETVLQDVRYGVRLLIKQRGFSVIAILTLALGIGATSALFSVIDAALIRPLPYRNPEQLVTIVLTSADNPARRGTPSVADMDHWRSLTHVFSHLATSRSESSVVIDGSQPEQITVLRVSADYFNLFGVAPTKGRLVTPADEPLSAPPVAILGHAYWQQKLGGDADVVGKQLRFADESATIVGIAPPWFYPRTPVFRPLQLSEAQRAARQWRVFARLRPGVTFEAAERDVSALTRTMAAGQADKSVTGAALMSMYEFTTTGSRNTLQILLAAVGLVLVLACVNVAGLQLARGSARHHELAVRASIGAGRSRLVRQLLTESVVLSIAGAALGLFLAWLILDVLVANIPVFLPSNAPIHIDWRVLGFTALLSIVAGITFGLVPALRLSRVQVSAALSQATRGIGSTLSRRTSGLLILAEVALAVVLLTGGGLMIRSFARLNAVNLGFDSDSFVTLEAAPIDPSHTAYLNYYTALVERIRAMPGIAAVGAVGNVPLSGSYSGGLVTVDGNSDGQKFGAVFQWILPGYIEALGLPLHAGRTFSNVELQQRLPLVVISEDAARKMFGSASPLGRHIVISKVPHEVIGIVGNVRDLVLEDSPMGRGTPELYLPYGLASTTTTSAGRVQGRRMTVVVRPDRPLPGLVDQLKQAAHDVGQPAVVRRIRTGNDWFGASVTTPRQRTVLLSLLGALGLVLACVGVFGMTSYSVTRRTQEIGVRMAFGARPRDVVRTMVRDSAVPLAIGIAVGIGGAMFATAIIGSFLYDTGARDPLTFAAVAVVLGVSGLLAAWIPARRAARVDPVKALGTG